MARSPVAHAPMAWGGWAGGPPFLGSGLSVQQVGEAERLEGVAQCVALSRVDLRRAMALLRGGPRGETQGSIWMRSPQGSRFQSPGGWP